MKKKKPWLCSNIQYIAKEKSKQFNGLKQLFKNEGAAQWAERFPCFPLKGCASNVKFPLVPV